MSRALIVDDKLLGRRALANELLDAGFDVILAKDGFEALDKMRESTPSVVISDFQMPEMDGIELLARLREFTRVPFILITAYDSPELRKRAINCGAQEAIDFTRNLSNVGALAKKLVTEHSASAPGDDTKGARSRAKAKQRVLRRAQVEQVLAECDWNISEAARKLSISRSGLRYQIRQLGISM